MMSSKIKINTNLSIKHFFLLVIVFSIIFIGISIYNACYLLKRQDYIKTEATITNFITHFPSTQRHNYTTYIEYSYLYNNTEFTNIQRTLSNNNKSIGQQIRIYINPNNPLHLEQDFFQSYYCMYMMLADLKLPFGMH